MTRKLTNHQIYLKHQNRKQRDGLTRAFKALEKVILEINDLAPETREHIFEVLNENKTPEENRLASHHALNDLYRALRATRTRLMESA